MRNLIVFGVVSLALGASSPLLAASAGASSPERIVVLPTERVGSSEPAPQSASAAREEAAAAWAENRRLCREEASRDARQECLEAAREDRDRLMDYARQAAGKR